MNIQQIAESNFLNKEDFIDFCKNEGLEMGLVVEGRSGLEAPRNGVDALVHTAKEGGII